MNGKRRRCVKRMLRGLMILAAHVVAIIVLADTWQSRPDLFPTVPEGWAIWLVNGYGATNADQVEDLEIMLTLGVSTMVVCAVSLGSRFVWRALSRRLSS